MLDITLILASKDGTIIHPRRPRDPVGYMEYAITLTAIQLRNRLGDVAAQDIYDWAAIPYDVRPTFMFRDDEHRLPLSQGEKNRIRRRLRRRRGQISPVRPVIYFLHKESNIVHQHGVENVFDATRLFKTSGTGDAAEQIPADPVDDGIYIGPYTSIDAKALIGGA